MTSKKTLKKESLTRDPDLLNAEVALRRTAGKARELARKAGTSIVYSVNGQLVKETPPEIASQDNKEQGS
jgi:hypothetical protein